MKREEIGYLREGIAAEYAKAIRECATVAALRRELADHWSYLTDALDQATYIAERDWRFVLKNAKVEKHGQRVNELAGHILIPTLLLKMAQITRAYPVTDGTALIRLLDTRAKKAEGK